MEDVLLEFESLQETQEKKYHTDQNSLYSTFRPSNPKFAWSVSGFKELKFHQDLQVENGSFVGNYVVSNDFDILRNLVLRAYLPDIRVNPEYKDKIIVCWCPYIGHNIIKNIIVKCDSFNEKIITPKWLDINYNFFINNKEFYNYLIGNRSELTKWSSDSIDATSIAFPLPVFNRNESFSFPIFRIRNLNDKLKFKSTYNLKLTKLIRMKMLNDEGKYVTIEPKMKYLDESTNKTIKIPKMFGQYVKLSEFDIQNRLSLPYNSVFENVYCLKSDATKITENERNVSIELESAYPVKGIFVCVVNTKKEKINLHSEYCIKVNQNGKIKKINPIKHISMKYNDNNRTVKFSKRDSIMSEVMEYIDLGGKTDLMKKYGMFYVSMSPDFTNFHNGSGVVLEKNTKATVDIKFDKYCIDTTFVVEIFLYRVKNLTIDKKITLE